MYEKIVEFDYVKFSHVELKSKKRYEMMKENGSPEFYENFNDQMLIDEFKKKYEKKFIATIHERYDLKSEPLGEVELSGYFNKNMLSIMADIPEEFKGKIKLHNYFKYHDDNTVELVVKFSER